MLIMTGEKHNTPWTMANSDRRINAKRMGGCGCKVRVVEAGGHDGRLAALAVAANRNGQWLQTALVDFFSC